MSEFPEDWDEEEEVGEIDRYMCGQCKNVWWQKYYDEFPDMNTPNFCPYCGDEFDKVVDVC